MILKALAITASHSLAFRDHFWEVQDILKPWNKNMVEQFTPNWVSCLDESNSTWTSKYTYPGWMFMSRKPLPFGNEYDTVCFSLSGILWQLELVEREDAPSTIILKFRNQGRTLGLLLQMEPIFGRGNVVVVDSDKKWKYWPKTSRESSSRSISKMQMWVIVICGRSLWKNSTSISIQ